MADPNALLALLAQTGQTPGPLMPQGQQQGSPLAQVIAAQRGMPIQRPQIPQGPPPSPVQQGAPQQGMPPSQGMPPDMQRQMQEREAIIARNQPFIERLAQEQEDELHGASKSQSAYKQLLNDSIDRLMGLQLAPDKNELMMRAGAGMSGKFGLAGDMARGVQSLVPGLEEGRQMALMKEQLQSKYGMEAAQADTMAHQYAAQAAQARMQPLIQQSNQSMSAADRLAMMAPKYDPQLQGQIARDKAMFTLMGQLAAARGAGGAGGGDQPGQPDPQTMAYATYQMQFPNPSPRSNPVQQAMYNDQLKKILAINPDFQQGNKSIADNVRKNFDLKYGDQIRFIGNVSGHLETYDRLMQQAQASGIKEGTPAYNQLIQAWSKQIGHPEITSAEAVANFLGPEFAKVIVPSGATAEERQEREKSIRASLSPEQWNGPAGIKGTLQEVLGTQASGLEHEFRSDLYFMPQKLVDTEWAAKANRPELQTIQQAHEQRNTPTQHDLDWLRANNTAENVVRFQRRFPGYQFDQGGGGGTAANQ